MRIAICSLSEPTHAVEFLDATERLSQRHEVLQITAWDRPRVGLLLRRRGVTHEALLAGAGLRPQVARGTRSLFREYFFAHAEALLRPLLRRLEAFRPDVVLSHLRDYAGLTAGEILGLPVVSFGSHPSPCRVEGIDPPFGAGLGATASRRDVALAWSLQRKFDDDLDPLFNQRLRRPFGLSAVRGASRLHSGELVILSLLPSLSATRSAAPRHVVHVGPLFSGSLLRPSGAERRATEALAASPRPRLFVSLGTTYAEGLGDRCLEALEGFSGTVVAAAGAAPFAGPGDRVIRFPTFEDVHAVHAVCDAVVSVGAGKTVLDALRHGLPLVCLPQQGEQREIAVALAAAGAAELPCLRRWRPEALRAAAERVVREPSYRAAAGRLRGQLEGLGGAERAAAAVEQLVAERGRRVGDGRRATR